MALADFTGLGWIKVLTRLVRAVALIGADGTHLGDAAAPLRVREAGAPDVGCKFFALGTSGSSAAGDTISNSTAVIKHVVPDGKVDVIEEVGLFMTDLTAAAGDYFTFGAIAAPSANGGLQLLAVDAQGATIETVINDAINNGQIEAALTDGKLVNLGVSGKTMVQGWKRLQLRLTAGESLQLNTRSALNGPTIRARIRITRYDA